MTDCDLCRIRLESDCPECEARNRRRRIEERFERLLQKEPAVPWSDSEEYDIDTELGGLWRFCERVETFLEGKRK